jgi:tRNA threonylcarbamoyladenosine biosynthesis protein TsaB
VITLAIDASTYHGDVALLDGDRVLGGAAVAMKDAHHERLMPSVADVLQQGRKTPRDLQRIVCGGGPGSFTSLRIAGGIAKGLAAGVGLPLFAVPSLALIVAGELRAPGRYLGILDAMRGEFYAGLYQVSDTGDVIELERAIVIAADQVETLAAQSEARIIGPTTFDGGVQALPKATGVVRLEQMVASSGPVDLASWEPTDGRLAEAQVKWESQHRRPLPVG